MPNDQRPEPERERNEGFGLFGLGLEWAVTLGSGAGLGFLADRWLDTLPWLTLAGTAFGFAVVLVRMYRTLRGMSR